MTATHKHEAKAKHNFTPLRLFFSFLLHPCVYSQSQEEGEPWASHYTYGKYVGINSTVHVWKMSSFFHTAADRFQAGGQAFLHCEVWQITYRNAPKKYVFSLTLCNILNILYFKYLKYLKFSYHRCRPTWNQCRGREVCSNGCNWPILCVSQQTVYVAGQTGGGAHCMVPQNKDCIIQSVQTILHSRLGGPQGLKSEELGRGRREEKRDRAA